MRTYRNTIIAAFAILMPGTAALAWEAPAKGSLVIVGGGEMPDSVRDRYMKLAGGKAAKLVVIPTASEYADKPEEHESYLKPWRKYEPASLKLLHTRSRQTAETEEFVKTIDEATAVWFSGGDQSFLTAAYLGTKAEKAFDALLARGGVIGGTSAGAAVMSEVMITGGREKASLGQGFGFLTGVVVDQHFLARSRLNRLIGVIAEKPELAGIGIDESTALVVEGGKWSVEGESFVLFVEQGAKERPMRIQSVRPGRSNAWPAGGSPFFEANGER